MAIQRILKKFDVSGSWWFEVYHETWIADVEFENPRGFLQGMLQYVDAWNTLFSMAIRRIL